jgi:hypothetical protein
MFVLVPKTKQNLTCENSLKEKTDESAKIDLFIVFGNCVFSLNGPNSENPFLRLRFKSTSSGNIILLHLAKIEESHKFIPPST